MESQIVEKEAFSVVGLRYFGKLDSLALRTLWQELRPDVIKNLVPGGAFGLMTAPNANEEFEYVAGFEVSKVESVPQNMVVRHIDASTYLAVSCTLPTIGEAYRFFDEWLSTSQYTRGQGYTYEFYNEQYNPQNPETSPMFVYFPISQG